MGTRFMEGKELMRQDITKDELGAQIAEYDGFAGVYPEHKFALVQAMQAKGMLIGMTGTSVKLDLPILLLEKESMFPYQINIAHNGFPDLIKPCSQISIHRPLIGQRGEIMQNCILETSTCRNEETLLLRSLS